MTCAPPGSPAAQGATGPLLCRSSTYRVDTSSRVLSRWFLLANPDVPGYVRVDMDMQYNARGQLLSVHRNGTQIAAYTYYEATDTATIGDLESATDELGGVTRYIRYSRAGWPLEVLLPNGVRQVFVYDAVGHVLSETRTPADGGAAQVVEYAYYRGTNALESKTENGAVVARYEYDDALRVTRLTTPLNSKVFARNSRGLVTSEKTFDLNGALFSEVTRTFDTHGRVTSTRGGE